ncbi:MAG: D-hexose-6-phosphate mutarotase [Hyphomicrobiaceae bacterium]
MRVQEVALASIEKLQETFGVEGRVAFVDRALGGPLVRIRTGGAEALVALHGGQVLNWLVRGQALLWLSSVARIREGRGIRGGIPVCWPWFADHPDDPGKPAHGFVRHRAWDVAGTRADHNTASVVLQTSTGARGQDRELWPHQAQARITIAVGDVLSVSLETLNTGETSFTLTDALHTYFRVSDISQVTVAGLDGLAYADKLDGFRKTRQAGDIRIAGEVDRIYGGDIGRIVLRDDGAGHVVEIEGSGSRSAVVWNPWTAKTARLGDMGAPDAFRQMVCIETANAGEDVIGLEPGERHTLTATYRHAGVS